MAQTATLPPNLSQIAQLLGQLLAANRQLFQEMASLQVMTKEAIHGQPDFVTNLDLVIESRLKTALAPLNIPIFAEESLADPAILNEPYCFVLDPIDGTQELISGRDTFATSIALLQNRRPIFGLLDFPRRGQQIQAIVGQGVTVNGRTHCLPPQKSVPPYSIAMSPFQFESQTLAPLRQQLRDNGAKLSPMGSLTAKVIAVALGQVDGAFFWPTSGKIAALWDFAAAGLILEEAGGHFSAIDGSDLLTCPPLIHENGWLATTPTTAPFLLEQLKGYY